MRNVAIVTGSSRGIGRATAMEFAAKGFKVFGLDLIPDSDSIPLTFLQVDVSDEGQVKDAVDQIGKQADHLDVLVNNAALCVNASMEKTTAQDWRRVIAINLTGPFFMMKAALPLLKRSEAASIVNVSSVHAMATSKEIAAYAASKGGLAALTRAAALELADYGIRVNCVMPGAVNTQMLTDGFSRGAVAGITVDNQMANLETATPLNRIARPEEIARTIYCLSSPDTASFITGQTLVVDGGALARLSTE